MSREFKLPDIGEGVHEGVIVEILVKEGEQVTADQPMLIVETDKVTVDITSPYTGIVTAINVQPGDVALVGDVLIAFDDEEGGAEVTAATEEPAATAQPTPAPGPTAPSASEPQAAPPAGAQPARQGPIPAAPATRRLARELGVALSDVPPTGPAGLVTAEDVRQFSSGVTKKSEPAAPPATVTAPVAEKETAAPIPTALPPAPLPNFDRWGPTERQKMTGIRRATARHMAQAWAQIPHVSHHDSADVTALEALRRKHRADIAESGGRLTLTLFVMKAVVAALKAFPEFNASVDAVTEEIVLKRYYHLGIAANTDGGLVVPVIRDVDRKNITQLARELHELAEKARTGGATLEELQGGTFTITNIGPLGGTGANPIINFPEVAILALGRAQLQPVVRPRKKRPDKTKIVPRLMLPITLTFDHRALDGMAAARFTRMVIDALEDPEKLLLVV